MAKGMQQRRAKFGMVASSSWLLPAIAGSILLVAFMPLLMALLFALLNGGNPSVSPG